MENDFLANIEQEGETPFVELDRQEEIPEGSQPEKIEEEVIPYHKDPRWIKQRQDLEHERKQREELAEETRKLHEEIDQLRNGKIEQPQFLTDLVGENEEVAKSFQEYEEQLTDKILRNIQEKSNKEAREKIDFERRNVEWINNSLDNLSAETGNQMRDAKGELTATGKELLDLISEYPVDDGYGNIDLKKGYSMLVKLRAQDDLIKTQKQNVRKDIADKTISNDNNSQTSKDYVSSNDIRNRSWYDL